MSFVDALKEALELVKLNRKAYARVAGNPATFTWALAITALAGVALGFNLKVIAAAGFLWMPFFMLLSLFIVTGLYHILAILLGGRGDYMGFVRIVGLSSILGWASMITFVGFIIGLWRLVVIFIALEEHYKLDTVKAIIVLILPAVLFFILGGLFLGAFLSALFFGG
jgi:hypothetical protein